MTHGPSSPSPPCPQAPCLFPSPLEQGNHHGSPTGTSLPGWLEEVGEEDRCVPAGCAGAFSLGHPSAGLPFLPTGKPRNCSGTLASHQPARAALTLSLPRGLNCEARREGSCFYLQSRLLRLTSDLTRRPSPQRIKLLWRKQCILF